MTSDRRLVDERGVIGPLARGSAYRTAAETQWETTDDAGFRYKPLYEAPGQRTWLMRVEPGAYSPPHAHEGELEQIYVLEGSFYDDERLMRAGDFCCRAPGAMHSAGSDEGAVVLLVYSEDKRGRESTKTNE